MYQLFGAEIAAQLQVLDGGGCDSVRKRVNGPLHSSVDSSVMDSRLRNNSTEEIR